MPLEEYRTKRKFGSTPEPPGRARRKASRTRIFVIQKHDATRVHYDFRLEIKEVLASWAVPRGPSLDPGVKRLAIRTEDHPIEYADFEDVIPPGQYGAGPVMVWDRGTYEPDDELSPEQQLARGEIKIVLHGIKLQGGFVLLYPGRSFSEPGEKTRWLLIKRRDEYADPSWQIDDPALDRSVLTGRTLKEIEENRPAKRLNAARVKHLAR
jgi:bifunctional non-homologous end joining protein LigD